MICSSVYQKIRFCEVIRFSNGFKFMYCDMGIISTIFNNCTSWCDISFIIGVAIYLSSCDSSIKILSAAVAEVFCTLVGKLMLLVKL